MARASQPSKEEKEREEEEKEEQEEILASVAKSVEALRDWIKGDNFIQTMNRYN